VAQAVHLLAHRVVLVEMVVVAPVVSVLAPLALAQRTPVAVVAVVDTDHQTVLLVPEVPVRSCCVTRPSTPSQLGPD
jgi:hypothetical protein